MDGFGLVMSVIMGGFILWFIGVFVVFVGEIRFRTYIAIIVIYAVIGSLNAAYHYQRDCPEYRVGVEYSKLSCALGYGVPWPVRLVWAGALWVTSPTVLKLPTIKWE